MLRYIARNVIYEQLILIASNGIHHEYLAFNIYSNDPNFTHNMRYLLLDLI